MVDSAMCVYLHDQKISYPDFEPNIPPEPPLGLGDEARPLRGMTLSETIKQPSRSFTWFCNFCYTMSTSP